MVNGLRAWARDCWPAWGVGGMLAIMTVFVGAPTLVPLVVPMSRYYELRSVTVADTTAGVSPRLIVDRVIRQDFRGRFEVEILRADGSALIVWRECGQHDSDWRWYRAGSELPPSLDLDWWMDIPPNRECPLPPGIYKIATTHYAQGPFGSVLSSTTESNVFRVAPVSRLNRIDQGRAQPQRPQVTR